MADVKPANLIFFLSDNHSRGALGCYGHSVVQTPALDGIAENGVRFDNAYCASPLCCPARAALATGRYPHQTRYWDNALSYGGRIASWMHRIRDQGHRVSAIGKLHFRSAENDNGFSEEIMPMHVFEGRGSISVTLRSIGAERVFRGFWDQYVTKSCAGEAPYQDYDRRVTANAIQWLEENGGKSGKPWVLVVSYPSPHAPFTVPQRLLDLYPPETVPLPPLFAPEDRPDHPALNYLRQIFEIGDISEAVVRRVSAAYFALITHTDEQIAQVVEAAESLGLGETTRFLYTSDHGEMYGSHGIFSKCCMYERSVGVPLMLSGSGVPVGAAVRQLVSHVDLFPTIVESVGAKLAPEDEDLPGASLWPAINGEESTRPGFAEYHADGTASGVFMLREQDMKLVHYVGMAPQLFDLAADPDETVDLADDPSHGATLERLTRALVAICDPDDVDRCAKADQQILLELWGGREKVAGELQFGFTPVPA